MSTFETVSAKSAFNMISGPESGMLYKFCSAKTALAILETHAVQLSSVKSFNDPFEGQFGVNWGSDEDLRRHIEQYHPGNPGMYEKGIERKRKFPNKPPPDVVEMVAQMGVSCFSEIKEDPLMWGHYADKHKGVCIGFRYKNLLVHMKEVYMQTEVSCLLKKVSYSDEFPMWEYGMGNYGTNIPAMKASCWKHEKEWRIVALASANKFLSLPQKAFSHMIFGAKTSRMRENQIVGAALAEKYNSMAFLKARIVDGEYKLKFNEWRPDKSNRAPKRVINPYAGRKKKEQIFIAIHEQSSGGKD